LSKKRFTVTVRRLLARTLRRWADAILPEKGEASEPVSWRTLEEPVGNEDRLEQVGSPAFDSGEPAPEATGEPPRHWVELVRHVAPDLLRPVRRRMPARGEREQVAAKTGKPTPPHLTPAEFPPSASGKTRQLAAQRREQVGTAGQHRGGAFEKPPAAPEAMAPSAPGARLTVFGSPNPRASLSPETTLLERQHHPLEPDEAKEHRFEAEPALPALCEAEQHQHQAGPAPHKSGPTAELPIRRAAPPATGAAREAGENRNSGSTEHRNTLQFVDSDPQTQRRSPGDWRRDRVASLPPRDPDPWPELPGPVPPKPQIEGARRALHQGAEHAADDTTRLNVERFGGSPERWPELLPESDSNSDEWTTAFQRWEHFSRLDREQRGD